MMNRWLRVPGRVLMVELAVVGLIIGGLFFLFLSIPLPVWAPATVLWGVTIGFFIYRGVSALGRDIRRMATEPMEVIPADFVDARTTQLLEYDGYGDVVAADMGWQEAVPDQVYDSVALPTADLSDGAQRDDLRATLFDVPSVGETSEVFDKLRVFTDEDLAAARSDTLLIDAVERSSASDERAPTLDEDTWRRLEANDPTRKGRVHHE